MATRKAHAIAGATAVVIGAGAVLALSSGGPSVDEGGNSLTRLTNSAPKIETNSLDPVGSEEASRRATLNDQKAKEAEKQPNTTFVAQPVISEEVNTGPNGPLAQKPPAAKPLPDLKPLDSNEIKVPQNVSIQHIDPAQTQQAKDEQSRLAKADDARRKAIQDQIDTLLKNDPKPEIAIVGFREPEKKERSQSSGEKPSAGSRSGTDRVPTQAPVILAAKPGDVFFASLKVGFNSDDPRGLPVFATIIDQKANGSVGPLHGGVLAGNVTYSQDQAAVTFREMTLRDGRTAPIQAMAATLDEVRPGIAVNVDRHILSRYSGLLAGSLLQGLGSAGQQLLQNDQTTTLNDRFAVVSGPSAIDWAKVGLAAVQPLGSNLSQVAARNFNQPPTVSSPANTEVAIVFLQQVTVAEGK